MGKIKINEFLKLKGDRKVISGAESASAGVVPEEVNYVVNIQLLEYNY